MFECAIAFECFRFCSFSHILNETFIWLSVLRKVKSSSQYTLNIKTFVMLHSFFSQEIFTDP